jgi:SAM-dependent methyltransferase
MRVSNAMADRDYLLGTHDDELRRLSLQHRVWRPRALDAWARAGFTSGQTLIDVGCGPGYATLDLAEIVGPRGRVIAVDRSRRFLDALNAQGISNIETHDIDLDDGALPAINADGAWVRWVFAFVRQPRALLGRVAAALKPGGVLVIHEYFDYQSWRFSPRSQVLHDFVQLIMRTWRESGGEPDVGLDLPVWIEELGLERVSLKPIVEAVSPSNFIWEWPKAFLANYPERLVELGHLDREGAARIHDSVREWAGKAGAIVTTPAVMEIVARRPLH